MLPAVNRAAKTSGLEAPDCVTKLERRVRGLCIDLGAARSAGDRARRKSPTAGLRTQALSGISGRTTAPLSPSTFKRLQRGQQGTKHREDAAQRRGP